MQRFMRPSSLLRWRRSKANGPSGPFGWARGVVGSDCRPRPSGRRASVRDFGIEGGRRPRDGRRPPRRPRCPLRAPPDRSSPWVCPHRSDPRCATPAGARGVRKSDARTLRRKGSYDIDLHEDVVEFGPHCCAHRIRSGEELDVCLVVLVEVPLEVLKVRGDFYYVGK